MGAHSLQVREKQESTRSEESLHDRFDCDKNSLWAELAACSQAAHHRGLIVSDDDSALPECVDSLAGVSYAWSGYNNTLDNRCCATEPCPIEVGRPIIQRRGMPNMPKGYYRSPSMCGVASQDLLRSACRRIQGGF